MHLRRRLALLTVVAALGISGCTATEPTPEETGRAAPDTEAVVETITVAVGGGEVEVTVYPLVRVDDHLVLTTDVVATSLREGETGMSVSEFFDLDTVPGIPAAGGALRLIDAEARAIHLPAVDGDGEVVGAPEERSLSVSDDTRRMQRVYAAPDAEGPLGLVLPGSYLADVPVIDGDPPAGGEDEDELDLSSVADAPVVPLESTTRELEGAVQVTQSTETLQISLAGDVLFAFGSADLGPDAEAILRTVVETLGTREAGVVEIVGHTDDVGDDASNQALSEARAAAVAGALATLVETDDFDLQPSGRGESEPLVTNDSEANRQLNRRVSLTLTTTRVAETEIPTEGELPPFEDGPVAAGAEGVELDMGSAGTFQVTVPSARRVDGMLEVVVEATRTDDGDHNVASVANLSPGPMSYRGEGTDARQYPFAPRLVVGTTAVYPLDYPIGADGGAEVDWRLAGQTNGRASAAGGQTLSFLALFPDVPGVDTITLETDGGPTWGTVYRLTDIPVQ